MMLIFADDSERRRPRRNGMDHLVAFGGFLLDADRVGEAESGVDTHCKKAGFPKGQEFKWSPDRRSWMRDNLRDDARCGFFQDVMGVLNEVGAHVVVALEDCQYRPANSGVESPEFDVAILFIERIERRLIEAQQSGLIITDETGGGRREDTDFMRACQDLLGTGTRYVRPKHIVLNVLCGRSDMMRLLQAADVVTSCVTAFVAGDRDFAPQVFESIRPMLRTNPVGGRSIKIHPDGVYINLYHWLFGDPDTWKGMIGRKMPLSGYPYAGGPDRRNLA